jgi:hypothetical protein
VFFPALRSFFIPSRIISDTADHQHDADRKEFSKVQSLLLKLHKSDGEEKQKVTKKTKKQLTVTQLLEKVLPKIEKLNKRILDHFKVEEDDMNTVGKKFYSMQMQKQLIKQIWELSTIENWNLYVPFIVNNLRYHGQKLRFLKSLKWVGILF